MQQKYDYPSFLNTSKIKISHLDTDSEKFNILKIKSKKKSNKSIVSFINFTKSKQMQVSNTVNHQNFNPIQVYKKKQQKKTQQFQQFQHYSNSQVGSQYGQKDYDQDLHQVLKLNKKPARKSDVSPNALLKTQKQKIHQQSKIYEKLQKFEKYETQIQKNHKNHNYSPLNIYQSPLQTQQVVYQNQLNNIQNSQQLKKLIKKSHKKNQTEKIILQKIVKFSHHSKQQSPKAFQLKHINNFQPFYYQKNLLLQNNRRSKTQEDTLQSNNIQSQEIFQNYYQLKKRFHRSSLKKKQFHPQSNDKLDSNINKRQTQRSNQTINTQRKNIKQPVNIYKSLPKYEPTILFNNTTDFQYSITKIIRIPKLLSKRKINDESMRKFIRQRQNQFFQKNQSKELISPVCTFEKIKCKLAQIQIKSTAKKHNKSSITMSTAKKTFPYPVFIQILSPKQPDKIFKQNQSNLRFKGLCLKPSLIKKNLEYYEKNIKNKFIENNLLKTITSTIKEIQH